MGRDSYSHRRVLEYTVGITIQNLKLYGLLNRGPVTGTWKNDITSTLRGTLASVNYTVQIKNTDPFSKDNFIQFEYQHKGQDISFKHQIETQPVHFGGYRYFFKCGAEKKGIYCGRRVKALYFFGPVWACRHCLELVYQNCRYSRDDTTRYQNTAELLQKKADTLRHYGHPRKANRLEWEAFKYSNLYIQEFNKKCQRFLKRY